MFHLSSKGSNETQILNSDKNSFCRLILICLLENSPAKFIKIIPKYPSIAPEVSFDCLSSLFYEHKKKKHNRAS